MEKYKCTFEELKNLLENKLNEDIIVTIYKDNTIIEIHNKGEKNLYKIRSKTFSKTKFKHIVKHELYYKLSNWKYLNDSEFNKLINDSRYYLEDLFFDL